MGSRSYFIKSNIHKNTSKINAVILLWPNHYIKNDGSPGFRRITVILMARLFHPATVIISSMAFESASLVRPLSATMAKE